MNASYPINKCTILYSTKCASLLHHHSQNIFSGIIVKQEASVVKEERNKSGDTSVCSPNFGL